MVSMGTRTRTSTDAPRAPSRSRERLSRNGLPVYSTTSPILRLITVPLQITVVDAFTDKPFSGNPAAVCVLPEERDKAWMQQVAREMNQAETAFMLIRPDHVALRWFTPTIEM